MVLGCNRLNAPYALADRVLSVGAVAKTRMACADPSFEEAGEKALALPFVVEAIGSEQVVLRNAVGTLNLAADADLKKTGRRRRSGARARP